MPTARTSFGAVEELDAAERGAKLALVAARATTSVHPGDPNPQELRTFGFAAGRKTITTVDLLTSVHPEVELLLLLRGWMEYSVAGRTIEVERDRLYVFWGGLPHRGLRLRSPTEYVGVLVPLAWVLSWPLPLGFAQDLVQGEIFREQDSSSARRGLDRALMMEWEADLNGPTRGVDGPVAMAVQSRLHRLALTARNPARTARAAGTRADLVARASQFIADNYREPITVPAIAAAAGVGAGHLMTVFKTRCDTSVWDYVVRLRLAHAQRLLATSDLNVLDIAVDSGFGSQAQFYEVFRRACGTSPRRYREQHCLPLT